MSVLPRVPHHVANADEARAGNLLPAMHMAAQVRGPVVLHAQLQRIMEHVLDRRRLPAVRPQVAQDSMPELRQDFIAQGLVSLPGGEG